MTKSEILAKIDKLRGQGNQTDIAGVLADVLQEFAEPKSLRMNVAELSEVSKEEAITALGITESEFQNLLHGDYEVLKFDEYTSVRKVYINNFTELPNAVYGGLGVNYAGTRFEYMYDAINDQFSSSINEV